jgi:hypothetical protein
VLLPEFGMNESRNLLAYAGNVFMRSGRALSLTSTRRWGSGPIAAAQRKTECKTT